MAKHIALLRSIAYVIGPLQEAADELEAWDLLAEWVSVPRCKRELLRVDGEWADVGTVTPDGPEIFARGPTARVLVRNLGVMS